MPLTSGGLTTGKLTTGRINDIRKADKAKKKRSKAEKRAADKKRAQDARDRDKADRERRRQKDKNLLDQKKADEEAREEKAQDENPAKAPDEQPAKEKGNFKGFRIGAIKKTTAEADAIATEEAANRFIEIHDLFIFAVNNSRADLWESSIEGKIVAYGGFIAAIGRAEVQTFKASKSEKAEMDR